jgi:hypothetical protein
MLVVAQLHFRSDLDGRLEDEWLALHGLDDLDVRVGQRQEVLVGERLAVGVLDEVVDGVVEDRTRTEVALQDGPWGLAGAEARDAGPARQVANGLTDSRSRRSAGSSISSTTVELGAGVAVICIAGKYRAGPGGGRERRRSQFGGCFRAAHWPSIQRLPVSQ